MLSSLRRHAVLLAAAFGMASAAHPVLAQQPSMISTAPRQVQAVKRIRHGAAYSAGAYGRKGAGISMAAQKRAARKARNVARNRRAHR